MEAQEHSARLFPGRREQVVVHRDHHRNEDDRVVEEMQLDARHPQLQQAGRHRPAQQVLAENRLPLQQRVLDVMEELNPERQHPPETIDLAGETGAQRPQAESMTTA